MIRFHEAVKPLLVPISTITPHPDNPNNGDVEEISTSILRNGCYRPVYVDANGTILAGHHLYAALMELGSDQVPVMFLDAQGEEAVRILLADNKIASMARIDPGLEIQLLTSLDDLTGTGYTDDDLADLLEEAAHGFGGAPEPEPLPTDEHTCPQCGHTWTEITV